MYTNNSVVHLFASYFLNSTASILKVWNVSSEFSLSNGFTWSCFLTTNIIFPKPPFLCNSCPKYFHGYDFLQNRILASPLVRRDLLALQLWIQSWVAASSSFPASLGEALVIFVKKTIMYSLKCHGLIISPSNWDSLFLEGHINPSYRGHMWILSSMYFTVMSCSHPRRAEWLD